VLRVVFCEADANAGIRGIRWAGYQAVIDYIDQYSPAKGPDVAWAAPPGSTPVLDLIKSQAFHVLAI
jgi:hypothetical protein